MRSRSRDGSQVPGDILEPAGIPPRDTRWVWRRKAKVVSAVNSGVLSLDEACRRYEMSIEEFLSWQDEYCSPGRHEQAARYANGYRIPYRK